MLVFKTSWGRLQYVFSATIFRLPRRLENDLKTSSRRICKTSSRHFFLKKSLKRLEDILARHLEDVLKTSWRRLEDVWPRWIYWSWSRRLDDVFMTSSSRRMFADYLLDVSLVLVKGVLCLKNVLCFPIFCGLNFVWLSLTVLFFLHQVL